MLLFEYGALWFVQQALDGKPGIDPHEENLPGAVDKPKLSRALVEATGAAGLMVPPEHVHVNGTALAADTAGWHTTFHVRDSLLRSAFGDDVAEPQMAFADYIVTRWIFDLVWALNIGKRPTDRELPPSYDQQAKIALANALRHRVRRLGLEFNDPDIVADEAAKWKWTSDVRNSILKHSVAA